MIGAAIPSVGHPRLHAMETPTDPAQFSRIIREVMRADHSERIDPVVAAAVSHYQFETLHPFRDGNCRLGRFLIVLQLLVQGVLTEPALIVSPWFEARRQEYYEALTQVRSVADQLVDLGVLAHLGSSTYRRRLCAPEVHAVLLRDGGTR